MRLCLIVIFYIPGSIFGQRLVPPRKYKLDDDDDDDINLNNDNFNLNGDRINLTEHGQYVGAFCETSCSSKLTNVYCNPANSLCECKKKFPVKLNPYKGCDKPKHLGDQCYYKESCQYFDQHSACIQVQHNAICQCDAGYHLVSIQKPSKKVFCVEDIVVISKDFFTFAGVLSGIAILTGLICFVLHLFNQNLYTNRRRRFNNTTLPPPILFSSNAGSLSLPLSERSNSRVSSHKTLTSFHSRVINNAPTSRGISTIVSRTGSRRPSIISIHSSASLKSFSAKKYEREREQKEELLMQKKIAKMNASSDSRISSSHSPLSSDSNLLPTHIQIEHNPPLAVKEDSSISFNDNIINNDIDNYDQSTFNSKQIISD